MTNWQQRVTHHTVFHQEKPLTSMFGLHNTFYHVNTHENWHRKWCTKWVFRSPRVNFKMDVQQKRVLWVVCAMICSESACRIVSLKSLLIAIGDCRSGFKLGLLLSSSEIYRRVEDRDKNHVGGTSHKEHASWIATEVFQKVPDNFWDLSIISIKPFSKTICL